MQEHINKIKNLQQNPEVSGLNSERCNLTRSSLERAKKEMGRDAFNLFELAYHCYLNKIDKLPAPPEQKLDISKLTTISLEGINCSGKTTQARRLLKIFEEKGAVLPPRFYECPPTKIIHAKSKGLFYQMFNPIIDSLLIASAYVDKFDRLNKGINSLIIADRGVDSLYVFQGRKLTELGYSIEESINWLMKLVKNVDRDKFRFYLDISVEEARRRNLGRVDNPKDILIGRDETNELSANLEMYRLLKEKFKRDYIIIDASLPINKITDLIVKNIKI